MRQRIMPRACHEPRAMRVGNRNGLVPPDYADLAAPFEPGFLDLFGRVDSMQANVFLEIVVRDVMLTQRVLPRLEQERAEVYFLERERDRPLLVCRFERGWFFTCTPARRASERPIAMAWRRLFALPFPRFILCIFSRTYSPACVEADLPARLSAAARFFVVFVGIIPPCEVAV